MELVGIRNGKDTGSSAIRSDARTLKRIDGKSSMFSLQCIEAIAYASDRKYSSTYLTFRMRFSCSLDISHALPAFPGDKVEQGDWRPMCKYAIVAV
jgi:hypothetical protein